MNRFGTAAALAATLLLTPAAMANSYRVYEVTIKNVTKHQTFTPILLATHASSVQLFELAEPASPELEILAEGGDTGPLTELLHDQGDRVKQVQTIGALGPGGTATVRVKAARRRSRLSVASMLIPTNDTFFALNGVKLPRRGSARFLAPAYDAGTEFNDQNCANMPGPRCMGEGHSPGPSDGDEGSIFISNGFHDVGVEDADGNEILGPFVYDWRNPVAEITVRRVR